LDRFRRAESVDPLHKWICTYNNYRMHLSPFFKWLYYLDIEPNTRQKPHVIESLSKRNGKGLSIAARHCKLNGLLNPISVAGSYPLVEVEYKDRQTKKGYPYNTR